MYIIYKSYTETSYKKIIRSLKNTDSNGILNLQNFEKSFFNSS